MGGAYRETRVSIYKRRNIEKENERNIINIKIDIDTLNSNC